MKRGAENAICPHAQPPGLCNSQGSGFFCFRMRRRETRSGDSKFLTLGSTEFTPAIMVRRQETNTATEGDPRSSSQHQPSPRPKSATDLTRGNCRSPNSGCDAKGSRKRWVRRWTLSDGAARGVVSPQSCSVILSRWVARLCQFIWRPVGRGGDMGLAASGAAARTTTA